MDEVGLDVLVCPDAEPRCLIVRLPDSVSGASLTGEEFWRGGGIWHVSYDPERRRIALKGPAGGPRELEVAADQEPWRVLGQHFPTEVGRRVRDSPLLGGVWGLEDRTL